MLNKPFIYGATSGEERARVLSGFRAGHPLFKTIFLSKVGDTSLDLPEATCLIQISSQFGSRRQEAQRMGRILRAKRRNEEGFRSRFYTLVTRDTDEVMFSSKRRRFLVDQGYEFKVISNFAQLIPLEQMKTLNYYKPEDQAALLELVKSQDDSVGEDEIVNAGEDDIAGAWQKSSGKRGPPKKGTQIKPAKERKTHALFKAFRR